MAEHNKSGKEAEALAVNYFRKKNYSILYTNWRFAQHEIDIIARKEKLLHFIEVKFRHSSKFGFPEEKVNKKKFTDLMKAADEFLFRHPDYRFIQFDILSITQQRNGQMDYFLIEDVYQ